MAIIPTTNRPTHERGGARFTSLASPARGSAETSVWIVEIDPGTPATPHSVTREEVFVVLDENPTAEFLARFIFEALTARAIPLKAVRFWETETSVATYEP